MEDKAKLFLLLLSDKEEVEELTREWQTLLLDMLQNDNNSITGMRPNIYSNNQCVVRDNKFLAFVRKWRGLAMRKSLNDGSPFLITIE